MRVTEYREEPCRSALNRVKGMAFKWSLVPMYEKLYAGRAYLPDAEVRPRRAAVATLAREVGVADRRAIKLVPVVPAQPQPQPQPQSQSPVEQLAWILSVDAEQRRAA